MSDTITKSEEKLFITRPEWSNRLRPICDALKMSGFETATIADIMQQLQLEPTLAPKFSIVNNRYLVYKPDMVYDLVKSEALGEQPEEPKRMAVIFWT